MSDREYNFEKHLLQYAFYNYTSSMYETCNGDMRSYYPKWVYSKRDDKTYDIEDHRQGSYIGLNGKKFLKCNTLLSKGNSIYLENFSEDIRKIFVELNIPEDEQRIEREFIITLDVSHKFWEACIMKQVSLDGLYPAKEIKTLKDIKDYLECKYKEIGELEKSIRSMNELVRDYEDLIKYINNGSIKIPEDYAEESIRKTIKEKTNNIYLAKDLLTSCRKNYVSYCDAYKELKKAVGKSYISLDALYLNHSIDFEIDGGQHENKIARILDRARDEFLEVLFNIKTIRLSKYGKGNPYTRVPANSYVRSREISNLENLLKSNLNRKELDRSYNQVFFSLKYFLEQVDIRIPISLPIVKEIYIDNLGDGTYDSRVLEKFIERVDIIKEQEAKDNGIIYSEIRLTNGIIKDVNFLLKTVFNRDITFLKPANPYSCK